MKISLCLFILLHICSPQVNSEYVLLNVQSIQGQQVQYLIKDSLSEESVRVFLTTLYASDEEIVNSLTMENHAGLDLGGSSLVYVTDIYDYVMALYHPKGQPDSQTELLLFVLSYMRGESTIESRQTHLHIGEQARSLSRPRAVERAWQAGDTEYQVHGTPSKTTN